MYTDRSRVITEHEGGNTAAAWVCSRAEPRVNKGKLLEYVSHYGAKIYAIMRAIK